MSIADLAKKWNTALNVEQPNQSKGITDAEAAKRLKEFGENAMSPPKGIPDWLKFLLKVRLAKTPAARMRTRHQRSRFFKTFGFSQAE